MDDKEAMSNLLKDLLEYKKKEAKFLFIALIVVLIINLLEVSAFLWYESQWEYTDTTTTTTEQYVDGDGNLVNGDQYNDQSQNKSGGNE